MTLSRRKMLGIIGGGTILAAGAGLGVHVTRPLQVALKPWELAGQYGDPRMNALSFALLAPNPHNRQPWKVDLSEPDQVTLYSDNDRLLPHTDPFSRQITIGLGCFLEVMRMAAAQEGYRVDLELFPEGSNSEALDARPVARAIFKEGAGTPDPLFVHVMQRRSVKEPFDLTRSVSQDALSTVEASVVNGGLTGGTVDMNDVEYMRDLCLRALVIETETPHTYKESVDLFRIGRAEVDANPDGIDFSGAFFETAKTFGFMNREAALDTSSQVYQGGIQYITENSMTAMGFIWLLSETNSRIDQINAGRDWVRMNLAATSIGLAMQPMSQALQEYPEMTKEYDEIHQRLAPGGETVQMFARVGYGPDVAPSPRWTLENKIIT